MRRKQFKGFLRNGRGIITLSVVVIGLLTLNGVSYGHGTEKHVKTSSADVQMKKLHDMMPMFSAASAKIEAALDKGDAAEVEVEAGKIIAEVPDLKKSKPHKNVKQRKRFVELASSLGQAATTTITLAKNGDFNGAKAAFKKVEKTCVDCHSKFRD